MKIGVFDSGLGGLVITSSFLQKLGEYDFVYLGDTKNLPYGDKSSKQVLEYTINAMKFLIKKNCKIIIIACNTASCVSLRYLQQIFIPQNYPDIKILGVTVPTVEEAISSSSKKIGVVATNSTINSHIYKIEIEKIAPNITVFEKATKELVPAIENNDLVKADELVSQYAKDFTNVDSLILGCTHYPIVKENFKKHLPNVKIISQDDFMGEKLKYYLNRHKEIECLLEKNSKRDYFVTSYNQEYETVAKKIIGDIKIKKAEY